MLTELYGVLRTPYERSKISCTDLLQYLHVFVQIPNTECSVLRSVLRTYVRIMYVHTNTLTSIPILTLTRFRGGRAHETGIGQVQCHPAETARSGHHPSYAYRIQAQSVDAPFEKQDRCSDANHTTLQHICNSCF